MQQPSKHPDRGATPSSSAKPRRWWFGCILIAATVLAYWPALHGSFVWDDDSWTTNISALLQNTTGLRLIWFQPTALQQYYPLAGTTFWLDYQLWKFWPLPYHVENVLLHALAALIFWRLLLRLQLPGAWLAAALFALHPVMVESAGWVTERKNVLSLALFLAALLAYLRYAQNKETLNPQPSTLNYALALVLFLGALLAKTTAFPLPAVILLLAWWQRGYLRWRADVLPTLPFFALAIGLCLVTAWLEKHHVGAKGTDFDLAFSQRCLVAGRVPWFYLGQLLWPAKLCFVYPRWQPDPGVWWQWLFPVATVGALLALWLMRKRLDRGPLTAALFFGGTMFPVLGFMNAYFMRYSFVCDHWVYLSSLGIFALVAAGAARFGKWLKQPVLVYGFAIIVLPVLAVLTWRQCGMYAGIETFWRTTIARNPNCWMAENNLGIALALQGKLDEALQHYERALQLKPDYPEALCNLGVAAGKQGKLDEAIQRLEQAIQLKPDYAEALFNLGTALAVQGKLAEAIKYFERVLQLDPDHDVAHFNLGLALASQGKSAEAIPHFQQALALANAHGDAALAADVEARLKAYPPTRLR